ncbi:MAG: 30S ribosomal protein S1, partial [Bacteroidales bacterium]|nr:30S ribosomal protein S1 [Bacteroidales bacterium]
LSHSRTFEDPARETARAEKRDRRPAPRKEAAAATIQNQAAAQTLGDLDALASLKAQLEKGN